MRKHPALAALQKASRGLRMPSEEDAPFAAFLWEDDGGELTATRLRQLAGVPEGVGVAEDSLEGLWRTVPAEDREQFQRLRQAIAQQLAGMKVFRVGDEPHKDVYLVGQTPDGKLAGPKTSVVET